MCKFICRRINQGAKKSDHLFVDADNSLAVGRQLRTEGPAGGGVCILAPVHRRVKTGPEPEASGGRSVTWRSFSTGAAIWHPSGKNRAEKRKLDFESEKPQIFETPPKKRLGTDTSSPISIGSSSTVAYSENDCEKKNIK